jgi:hypothetical protein
MESKNEVSRIFKIIKHKDGIFEDSIWELRDNKLKCVFPAKAKDFYLGFEVLDPKKTEILEGILEKKVLQSL